VSPAARILLWEIKCQDPRSGFQYHERLVVSTKICQVKRMERPPWFQSEKSAAGSIAVPSLFYSCTACKCVHLGKRTGDLEL
jgi:hypothetical protein